MRSLTAAVAAALVLLPAAPAFAAGQAPVAVDDAVSLRNTGGIDHLVPALANDSDPDGDVLTYTAVTAAAKGNAFLRDGQLFYKPFLGNTGTDSFTYTVSDGQGNTATGTVTASLWVDPPRITDLTLTQTLGTATLSWSPAQHAAQYRVYRNGELVHTTSGLTWTDTGILDHAANHYSVTGVNGGGFQGLLSDSVSRWPRPAAPGIVVVTVTDDPTALDLSWPADPSGPWRVYRDGQLVTTTTEARFRDTGLVTGREYGYQLSRVRDLESPLSGTFYGRPVVLTPIARLYRNMGSLFSVLGPITVPERAVPGGRQQDHEFGLILQATGEAAFAVAGDLAPAYTAAGGADSLGFPVAEEECGLWDDGCGQLFEHGSVWASAWTRATVVRSTIEEGWAATGWEDGPLGYPANAQVGIPGGLEQAFQYGSVHWSPATGSHGVSGPIHDRWTVAGRTGGRLGFPTAGELCGLRGDGCVQSFQGGLVYWSPTTGGHVVLGAIRTAYAKQGWETGRLGYPTSSEICGLRGGGCFQWFQGGSIYWSPANGAHVVLGAIRDAWARQGWENGRLGYPIGSESFSTGTYRQNFQGGTITLTIASGQTRIVYR